MAGVTGMRVASRTDVICLKRITARPKDVATLSILERFMKLRERGTETSL